MSGKPTRVAFVMIPRRSWAGGYNYQSNLFSALARYCYDEIAPVVFAGQSDDQADLDSLEKIRGVEVARSPAFDVRSAQLASALLSGCDRVALTEFRKNNVDVVFESARFFGWRFPYPTVAWIPDLQHRRLPQLFTAGARWRRDIGFRAQIASGRQIMLSSNSALKDFLQFYPSARGQTSVVRFATNPQPELLNADPSEIVRLYELPSNFFYLPNQFWRHKNHEVVIEALEILKRRGVEVVIAASGSHDLKEPDCLDSIKRKVAERGLQKVFRYLGMIPMPHVYALLRATVGLINPSRFEGWSTTVEEAKSFGVPMILSDIDVHREQASDAARYFGEDDAEGLAGQLARLADAQPLVRDLADGVEDRVAKFATDFVQTIKLVARMNQQI